MKGHCLERNSSSWPSPAHIWGCLLLTANCQLALPETRACHQRRWAPASTFHHLKHFKVFGFSLGVNLLQGHALHVLSVQDSAEVTPAALESLVTVAFPGKVSRFGR